MNVYEMIVIIVVVSLLAGVVNNLIKMRAKGALHRDALEEKLARIDELEERIRVLEAVVTDGKFELKQAFRALEED